MLHRDYLASRVFDSLAATIKQAEKGLATMAADKNAMKNLSPWPFGAAQLIAEHCWCHPFRLHVAGYSMGFLRLAMLIPYLNNLHKRFYCCLQ